MFLLSSFLSLRVCLLSWGFVVPSFTTLYRARSQRVGTVVGILPQFIYREQVLYRNPTFYHVHIRYLGGSFRGLVVPVLLRVLNVSSEEVQGLGVQGI